MIELYTREDCSFCIKAKELLVENKIPFVEKKLGEDYTRDFLLDNYPKARTYPVIVNNGTFVGGYSELLTEMNNGTLGQRLLNG